MNQLESINPTLKTEKRDERVFLSRKRIVPPSEKETWEGFCKIRSNSTVQLVYTTLARAKKGIIPDRSLFALTFALSSKTSRNGKERIRKGYKLFDYMVERKWITKFSQSQLLILLKGKDNDGSVWFMSEEAR